MWGSRNSGQVGSYPPTLYLPDPSALPLLPGPSTLPSYQLLKLLYYLKRGISIAIPLLRILPKRSGRQRRGGGGLARQALAYGVEMIELGEHPGVACSEREVQC